MSSVNAVINHLFKLPLILQWIIPRAMSRKTQVYKRLTRTTSSTSLEFWANARNHKGTSVQGEWNADAWWRGRKSRGNARRVALGAGVHAYATISFDYIIVFRPSGIIHVNKLHIFFHFASPSPSFFCATGRAVPSSYCRDFVVAANSRRLFDPPLSRFLFARRVRKIRTWWLVSG